MFLKKILCTVEKHTQVIICKASEAFSGLIFPGIARKDSSKKFTPHTTYLI